MLPQHDVQLALCGKATCREGRGTDRRLAKYIGYLVFLFYVLRTLRLRIDPAEDPAVETPSLSSSWPWARASSLRLRLRSLHRNAIAVPRSFRSLVAVAKSHQPPTSITIIMNLAPSWKAYFAARESNARGNQNPLAYLTAWSHETTPKAKLHLLNNDPDTAILAGDSGQGIMILHSFKNLGGSILSPPDKFVCLVGGTRMAPIVIANDTAISESIELVTPSAEDILACTTVEELLDLHPPLVEENPDTITFRGSNTFLPPPWLLDTIFNARSDNPYELILAAKAGATSFNNVQLAANPNYIAHTDVTLNEFAMWAWATKRDLIPPTGYYLDPNDEDIDNYHNLRHQRCILTLPPPPLTNNTGAGTIPPTGAPPTFNAPVMPLGNTGTHPPNPTPTTLTNDIILQQLAVSITRQSEEAATHNELFARQLEHSLEKETKRKTA